MNLTRELSAPFGDSHGGETTGFPGPRDPRAGQAGGSCCPGRRLTPLPRRWGCAGLGRRGRRERLALAASRGAGSGRAGASPKRPELPGVRRRGGRWGRSSCSRHAPLGEDFKPLSTTTLLLPPRRAPATGGGPRIIGRASQRRVLIGRRASRPRFGVRRRLHFVGRGSRRRSIWTPRWPAAILSVLVGFAHSCLVAPWKGRGASTPSRSRSRRGPELEVARTSLKFVC
nr:proline-rich nuclear receptor coactivator 2 isoform X1 [Camelus dromedarius]